MRSVYFTFRRNPYAYLHNNFIYASIYPKLAPPMYIYPIIIISRLIRQGSPQAEIRLAVNCRLNGYPATIKFVIGIGNACSWSVCIDKTQGK